MLTASIPTIGVPLQGASSLLFRGVGYEWADLAAGILDPSLRPDVDAKVWKCSSILGLRCIPNYF